MSQLTPDYVPLQLHPLGQALREFLPLFRVEDDRGQGEDCHDEPAALGKPPELIHLPHHTRHCYHPELVAEVAQQRQRVEGGPQLDYPRAMVLHQGAIFLDVVRVDPEVGTDVEEAHVRFGVHARHFGGVGGLSEALYYLLILSCIFEILFI